jgi:hypothetical protein
MSTLGDIEDSILEFREIVRKAAVVTAAASILAAKYGIITEKEAVTIALRIADEVESR